MYLKLLVLLSAHYGCGAEEFEVRASSESILRGGGYHGYLVSHLPGRNEQAHWRVRRVRTDYRPDWGNWRLFRAALFDARYYDGEKWRLTYSFLPRGVRRHYAERSQLAVGFTCYTAAAHLLLDDVGSLPVPNWVLHGLYHWLTLWHECDY